MGKVSQAVGTFLDQLDHPLKMEIKILREIILSADKDLTEHIKWNAPSFCHQGDDRITFNFLPRKDYIQLVFHRGVKVKEMPAERLIQDHSGLLEWKSNDRAIVKFSNAAEIENHKITLKIIIREWIKKTSANN